MPSIRYTTIAAVVLAFATAAVVVRIAHAVVHRLLEALDIAEPGDRAAVQARAKQLIRALTLMAYGIAVLASISLALTRFGIDDTRWDPRTLGRWSATHGINMLLILAGAFVV